MLKKEMLEAIYTDNMLKAKRYYLGWLRKRDLEVAYEMSKILSNTKAREYLEICIRCNRRRGLKRLDLDVLKYIKHDVEAIEGMIK